MCSRDLRINLSYFCFQADEERRRQAEIVTEEDARLPGQVTPEEVLQSSLRLDPGHKFPSASVSYFYKRAISWEIISKGDR